MNYKKLLRVYCSNFVNSFDKKLLISFLNKLDYELEYCCCLILKLEVKNIWKTVFKISKLMESKIFKFYWNWKYTK